MTSHATKNRIIPDELAVGALGDLYQPDDHRRGKRVSPTNPYSTIIARNMLCGPSGISEIVPTPAPSHGILHGEVERIQRSQASILLVITDAPRLDQRKNTRSRRPPKDPDCERQRTRTRSPAAQRPLHRATMRGMCLRSARIKVADVSNTRLGQNAGAAERRKYSYQNQRHQYQIDDAQLGGAEPTGIPVHSQPTLRR